MSIYREFGLEPIINASGSVTRLGGSPMPTAVLDAFRSAASETVTLEQLQDVAAERIAAITLTESGLVTAGSAAASTLGAAAILTGHDPGRMERLPHCDGFPHEFLIAREQRSGYDHAIRAAGARLVEVGLNEIVSNAGVRRTEAWEYEAAINENTAGIAFVLADNSRPPLEEVVNVAHRHQLPVLVDAAGELPPRSNLTAIARSGADLICFSGGKAIRGPQSTGILCGRRDLISAAALQMLDMDDHPELWDPPSSLIDRSKLRGMPRHGIGRALKVSKEEIAALLVALELFASGAYDADQQRYQSSLETIAAALTDAPVNCTITEPKPEGGWPTLEIAIDEEKLGHTAFDVCRRLRDGTPPIYASHGKLREAKLVINPTCLTESQVSVLADRLRAELS